MKKVGIAFDKASVRPDMTGAMCAGVYAITTPSGAAYVGSAVNFDRRWKQHLLHLRSGKHHNYPLQRAYLKYGEEALSFSKLLICGEDNLLMYEQIAIDAINPEYNICKVAGSKLGSKLSAETRLKMSISQRARGPRSMETREKNRLSNIGRPVSDETKQKQSAASRAYWSRPESIKAQSDLVKKAMENPEVREKISSALKGIKRSPEFGAKISAAKKGVPSGRKGIPRSEEVRAKISAGNKAAAERKKNAQAQAK